MRARKIRLYSLVVIHIINIQETLQRLLCILESISKLERLLKIKRSLQDNPEDEEEMSEIEHLAEKLVS